MAPTWSSQVRGDFTAFTVLAAPPPCPAEAIPSVRDERSAALTKSSLRAFARRHRRVLAAAHADAAIRAAARLPLEALPPAAVVAGYAPIGAELEAGPVLARFEAAGARILLPRIEGETLVFVDDAGAPAKPDLIVAPLLAFDRHGFRLGQGGGHYDRAIAGLRAHGPVFVLGLAYAGQEVDALPAEPHDERLDAVLTEMDYRTFTP